MTTDLFKATLLEETVLRVDELAATCTVTREWVIEHVRAGVLLERAGPDPLGWTFTSHDLIRAKHLHSLERQFDANPELAGLVVDLTEELERLRARLKREGLSLD
ncbi:MAG TPA: MerR family transcriptional regulator [Casimicrobiaceae bacterium]|nr:MerR family transcriptional regulator [Casimicrobiaceae bacterium]